MPTLLHSILCNAPAAKLYAITRESDRWPELFPPCLGVEVLERSDDGEVIRIKALANDTQMSWRSRRSFHQSINGVDFEQVDPSPLVATMNGRWRSVPIGRELTLLSVEHSFSVKDNVDGLVPGVSSREEATEFMCRTVQANSQRELAAIKELVEASVHVGDRHSVSFSTRRTIRGKKDQIFDLLANAKEWPSLLPHCEALEIVYDDGIDQEFIMEVKVAQGKERIRSIRHIDRDARTISYFQPAPPPVLQTHRGAWVLTETDSGIEIVAHHSFQVNEARCVKHFGHDRTLEHLEVIQQAIERASLSTIAACEQAAIGGASR